MAATNRSKAAAEARGAATGRATKPMSSGIGESKLHGGGGEEKDMSGYTVNGEPIPRECWQTFPFSLTDQAKVQMAEERRNLPVSYAAPRPAQSLYRGVTDDDKKAQAFRDALAEDTEGLTMSVDPMGPLLEAHTPKGHKGMFMSRKQTAERGLTRGVLTYAPVLIPDGKGGMKEVTCGNMFLASVPESLVRKSDAYYARINHDKQVTAIDKVEDAADRLVQGRDRDRLLRKKGAGDAGIGFETEDQELGDRDMLRNLPLAEPLVHED